MTRFWPHSLTARLALLFAASALLTLSVVGVYLYRSLANQLQSRDEHELIGKVEQYRHILIETPSVRAIRQDQHRFIDVATGHDGLIVFLRAADGQILVRNQNDAVSLPDIAVVPANETPDESALKVWEYAPGRVATTISAWGRLADPATQVQIIVARTASDRMSLLDEYLRDILGAVLSGAACAAMLGFIVVRRSLRPVKAVAEQAHSITARRLDKRLEARAVPSELQTLVQSFNAVLDRLQESFQRLSQFSADLAHDLRTPLYNLTMQTQVALSKPRGEDEYVALLGSGLEEYERLTRMVESMLFLARADNAQVALNRQPLDGQEELQRIADYFEGIAEDVGVRLAVDGSATVNADPTLFRRAVNNLVSNAIRFTPSGGTVRLFIEQKPTSTLVSVSNPGKGIAAEHQPRLFDRFYRVDEARSHSASSTGLGLAIVASIMKLHGGQAMVSSTPNEITTFTLLFPIHP
ncbi:heavy metal sensor histidine kinase [Noviherbaspirillum sp. CPCC 100848]|uniref:Sensor protein n=1 Tax=Noviherbaspirillum album TaxID=3080276 RepID=A0ABU6J3P8_9BURK|nr:heavy metal sensor histidine kinase [Noviherbaspirillum sp. CPCC 100848]MEC4718138.1 heavy metal sensor histidine kinase [Noviherbaspirillum sp. CPCC 100848]